MKYKKLPNKNIIAHACLLLAVIIWSASGPIIKLTLNYITPGTFLFFRFLIVCIVLLPFLFFELKKHTFNKRDLFNIFIIGLLSQSSLYILFVSFEHTGALDITIIGVMASIASVWFGNHFYKDKIDIKLTVGLIIASIGTFIVVIEPILMNNSTDISIYKKLFGNILAILYNVFFVSYLVFSKIVMGEKSQNLKKTLEVIGIKQSENKIKPFIITSLSFYVGLITTIPIAIYEYLNNPSHFNILQIDTIGLLGILYMAFIGSIVGYISYQYGLKNARVSDTAIYGYLGPVFTLPFAYFLINETPNIYMLIGAIVISLGVIVAEAKNN